MKTVFFVSLAVVLLLIAVGIYQAVAANYTWERDYLALWSLADKASTIDAKRDKLTQFCEALSANRREFAANNAVFLLTADNSFEANYRALVTLTERLNAIANMDAKSFEYNTAIQQITAQEQGEAREMLDVFYGCYRLENYPVTWHWIGGLYIIPIFVAAVPAVVCFMIWTDG